MDPLVVIQKCPWCHIPLFCIIDSLRTVQYRWICYIKTLHIATFIKRTFKVLANISNNNSHNIFINQGNEKNKPFRSSTVQSRKSLFFSSLTHTELENFFQ